MSRVLNPIFCLGDRWRRLQAVQDPRCAQVRRQGPHRHGPEAEGEPPQVLQVQEVHAPGPEAQEDQGHQEEADPPRGRPQDPQGAQATQGLPRPQVCRQSLNKTCFQL